MDATAEIKKLYYAATKATIQRDLDRAIDLLKTLPDEEARDKVAVYMDGLAQMRSEWKQGVSGGVKSTKPSSALPVSGPRSGPPRGRSGPSKASSRQSR